MTTACSKKFAKKGRPTKYQSGFAEQAGKLAKLGHTDAEIADFFGVSESTLNLWKKRHADFSESLKSGKDRADAKVAESLYRRAMGYSHPAVKIMVIGKSIEQVPYIEHYPPDTTACIFWLKNRQPKNWRDKVQQEVSGPDGGAVKIDHSHLTPLDFNAVRATRAQLAHEQSPQSPSTQITSIVRGHFGRA